MHAAGLLCSAWMRPDLPTSLCGHVHVLVLAAALKGRVAAGAASTSAGLLGPMRTTKLLIHVI